MLLELPFPSAGDRWFLIKIAFSFGRSDGLDGWEGDKKNPGQGSLGFFYGDLEGVREGMRFDNSLRIARIKP